MKRFILILIIALASLYVVWPQRPGSYIPGGDILPGSSGIHIGGFDRQGARLGLDLLPGWDSTCWVARSSRYRRTCPRSRRSSKRSR
jgi:hypothetical protein